MTTMYLFFTLFACALIQWEHFVSLFSISELPAPLPFTQNSLLSKTGLFDSKLCSTKKFNLVTKTADKLLANS